jgi:hypothetical protein
LQQWQQQYDPAAPAVQQVVSVSCAAVVHCSDWKCS